MPVLAGATDDGPTAFLVATPTGPVLLIADLHEFDHSAVDGLRAKTPQLPIVVLGMPITLVGSFDG